jgi:ankyrin repeat protein
MRGLFDIVFNGTLAELRQALPSDKRERMAAVWVFDRAGTSLLSNACWWGRWDMAAALVQEHGLPVEFSHFDDGITALHQMCGKGRTGAALFLIRTLGANPHAVTGRWGGTALHCACQGGHTELARILVRDFRLNTNAVDNAGETPLHKASLGGHTGTALWLISDLGARRCGQRGRQHASHSSGR